MTRGEPRDSYKIDSAMPLARGGRVTARCSLLDIRSNKTRVFGLVAMTVSCGSRVTRPGSKHHHGSFTIVTPMTSISPKARRH